VTHVVVFVAATGGVLIAGGLAATLLGLDDPLDWSLAVGVLTCTLVLGISLIAGVLLDQFEPSVLIGLTAAADAALVFVLIRSRQTAATPVEAVRGAVAVARRLAPWQIAIVSLALIALAWRAVLALVLPPFAYDALAYHLTAVASWVQSGQIGVNPYADCCGHYPSNAEVLFAWPTVLLHRDSLTDTVQIGLALIGALAVGGLARWAGASGPNAVTAAALFILTPIVLTQANVDYNDVAVAAMLLAGLYFGARYLSAGPFLFAPANAGPPQSAFLLLAAISAGFLLGTKVNGILLAGVVVLLLFAQLATAAARGRLSVGRAAAGVGIVFGAILLLGGYWYARNWVQTGNPLWPVKVDGLFQGPRSSHDYLTVPPGGSRNPAVEVARSWYHDLVFWTRSDYSYEERDGGLGPLWSWVGWGAVLSLAVYAFRRRRDIVVNLLLPLGLIFAAQPYRWWSRFTIYLAALGAIGLVVTQARLRGRLPRTMLACAAVALALGGAARATWQLDPAGRGRKLTATDVVDLAAHSSRIRTVGSLFFPEFRWLNDVPAHATIAVETNAPSIRFLYPLFGERLDRRVVQLLAPRPKGLAGRLDATRSDFLAVESRGVYARWARRQPRAWRLVFDRRGVAVFRRIG
jgi:hypothetical protein